MDAAAFINDLPVLQDRPRYINPLTNRAMLRSTIVSQNAFISTGHVRACAISIFYSLNDFVEREKVGKYNSFAKLKFQN